MIEKSKKHKKGLISEEDVSTLLQRYTATTVLALLQEVAQFEGVRIDWNALVKKTSTGISNAREYQMLWRHIAYRHALLQKLEDGAQPLDDDSDLEFELQAFPNVTSEASTEAAACVKVLIASGLPSDSSQPISGTVEAPLTINIPNGQSFRATSENSQPATIRGLNITVPVSVQKQPLPAVTYTEGFDANGSPSGTIPPRRKRKPWSQEEDSELIAAVEKFGEGNWAHILRGDYKGERTASQLSQRWSVLRKRRRNLNPGTNSTRTQLSGAQLSEAQQAARHAMNLALDPPAKSGTTSNNTSIICPPPTTTGEGLRSEHQSQQRPIMTQPSSMGPVGSATKPLVTLNKTLVKSNLSSDPTRAAAVATGAHIASAQSDAVSLLKAAQAKHAVHVMPTGSSSIKSSVPGSAPTHLEDQPNVHFISTGLAAAPVSICPAISSSGSGPKDSSPKTLHNPSSSATSTIVLSEQTSAEHPAKQDGKTAEGIKSSGSEDVAKKKVQENGACVCQKEPSNQVQEDKVALLNQEAECKSQATVAESSNTSTKLEMANSDLVDVINNQVEGNRSANGAKIMCSPVEGGENESAVKGNGENQSMNNIQKELPSMITDESSEKLEAVAKAEPNNGKLEGEG